MEKHDEKSRKSGVMMVLVSKCSLRVLLRAVRP